MEQEYGISRTELNAFAEMHGESLETVMQRLAAERCRKIQYADLTEDTFVVLSATDADGNVIECAEFAGSSLGESFLAFADSPLCYDSDRERFRRFTVLTSLKTALEGAAGEPVSLVYRRKFSSGDAVFSTVSMELYPLQSNNGHVTAILLVRDITAEIQQYNVSLDENAKLQNHIPGKRTILVVEDNEMNREILSDLLSDEYRILEAENGAVGLELLQKHMMEVSVVILDVQMPVMNGYEFLQHTRHDPFLSKIPVIVATGSNSQEEERECLGLGASDFVGKPYNPDIIRSRIANIIRLKESTATMSALQMDDRTGLYTLQAFHYHAKLVIDKDPDADYTVAAIDVERFKQLIECYDENTGNRVLREIAGVLQQYMACSDIYGRFGAARFLILDKKREDSEAWIRKLLSDLEAACTMNCISFKAGVYENIDKTLSVPLLCDRAFTALNSVGRDYAKRYALYDEKHAEKARRLAVLESDMRAAYDNDEFSVYYQPKHDARTGQLMGAEALIRWVHPEFGFLSPGEFIPLFEKNGFVTYADYYVLKRTCRNLRAWQDEGIAVVPVSVNSSRRDFDREPYLETVLRPLQRYNIDPSLIHIEVTESMFSDTLDEISRILHECREAGFKIELDDFGSGYSSLTTLTILPLDVMKLDMSFMKNYKDEKKRKVLFTCIALAKSLSLKTVCEGVEIEEQLELLKKYGCDLIQGYYFSKPIPEAEFREYLIREQAKNELSE